MSKVENKHSRSLLVFLRDISVLIPRKLFVLLLDRVIFVKESAAQTLFIPQEIRCGMTCPDLPSANTTILVYSFPSKICLHNWTNFLPREASLAFCLKSQTESHNPSRIMRVHFALNRSLHTVILSEGSITLSGFLNWIWKECIRSQFKFKLSRVSAVFREQQLVLDPPCLYVYGKWERSSI